MFPLGTVLVPGASLPLRVFEPRYQVLLHDIRVGDIAPEFGVVLIERGREVGGGEVRFQIGCVARVVEAEELGGGHWRVATVGDRRIRIEGWLDDDPYPRAEVQNWPDPAPLPSASALVAAAGPKLRRVLAMASELGASIPPNLADLSEDPTLASYQLAIIAPMGELDRLSLLAASSVEQRLEDAARLLDEAATLLALRLEGG